MHYNSFRYLVSQHTGIVARVLSICIGDVQATQRPTRQHVRFNAEMFTENIKIRPTLLFTFYLHDYLMPPRLVS